MSRDERVAAADRIAMFLQVLHGLHVIESIRLHLPHDDECAGAVELRYLAEQVVLPQLSTTEARRLLDRFDCYVDTQAVRRVHLLVRSDNLSAGMSRY